MEVEYRRDLGHNYVVLGCQDQVDTTSYQVRMMLSNDIEGLLGCSIRGMDGRNMFCYEITSHQSLKALFEHGAPGQGIMIRLYEEIFAVLERLQRFLLNMDGLVLEPELIFFSPGKEKVNFCFLPGYERDIRQSLRELMEYLLPKIDHRDPAAVMAGYGLYRKVMEENCDLEEMRSVLLSGAYVRENGEVPVHREESRIPGDTPGEIPDELAGSASERERQRILDEFFEEEEEEESFWKRYLGIFVVAGLIVFLIVVKCLAMPGWFFLGMLLLLVSGGIGYGVYRFFRHFKSDAEADFPVQKHEKERETDKSLRFERSSFFEEVNQSTPEYGETEVLAEEARGDLCARLEGMGPGRAETIALEKEITLVGKLCEAVDVVLQSNTVSRIHARIFRDGEIYFVEDLNSRNGTYVNGQAVTLGSAVTLRDGDEIRFGGLTYLFRITTV